MAKGLTEKQRKILEYIIDFQKENGFPPTIRELGDAFQIGSLRGVTVHLDALVRKGFMTRERTSRSIRVTAPDPREALVSPQSAAMIRLPLIRSLGVGSIAADKIAIEGQFERHIEIPEELAGPATENGFVIRVGATGVRGEPIVPGDLLVVRPQSKAVSGEIVVLYSHTKMQVVRADDQVAEDTSTGGDEIIGRVVGLIRRY